MNSGLADFIEHHAETIIEHAITFAKTVEVGTPLDDAALRDHLPEIVEAIVVDLRTPQTRAEEIEKSEGRALVPIGRPRSAAGTHALHRAHSGYSISNLVSEYRALRASVLRLWAEAPDREVASAEEVTRFNEAIDEAIAESVSHYADEVERWRNIFLGVLGHDLRSPLSAIVMSSQMIARVA
ncbi:two-component sensor histidine kinase, partial [Lysobacter sp. GCM10012299]